MSVVRLHLMLKLIRCASEGIEIKLLCFHARIFLGFIMRKFGRTINCSATYQVIASDRSSPKSSDLVE